MVLTRAFIKKIHVDKAIFFALFLYSFILLFSTKIEAASYSPTVTYSYAGADDQDDMAIWIHPTDPSKSLVFGSDKYAFFVGVYDLQGNELQKVTDVGKPGNIDVRYDFQLGGQLVDIVAFNDRQDNIIRVFKIAADQRSLERIDDGTIASSFQNYGFGLYKSSQSGKFYAFATKDNSGGAEQYELVDNGAGKITGSVVRTLTSLGGQSEGVVADDYQGKVFIGEEACCIQMFDAEPSGSGAGEEVLPISGTTNLSADIEGLTIYHTSGGGGYLIASSQGSNEFVVFDKNAVINGAGQAPVAVFGISGASSTDGIDVSPVNLGGGFASGVFFTHSGGTPFFGTPWSTIANGESLTIDTSWNPRGGSVIPTGTPLPSASVQPSTTPPASTQPSTSPSVSPSGTPAPSPGVLVLQPGDEGIIDCAADVLQNLGFNTTQTQLNLFCKKNVGSNHSDISLALSDSVAFECPSGMVQSVTSGDAKKVDLTCVPDQNHSDVVLQTGESAIVQCSANALDLVFNDANTQVMAHCSALENLNVALNTGESTVLNCSGNVLDVLVNSTKTQADALCHSATGSDTLILGFSIQGVVNQGVQIPVSFTFVSASTNQTFSTSHTFVSDAAGIMRPDGGSLPLPIGIADGNEWSVYVKAPVTLRKSFGNLTFAPGETTAPQFWDSQSLLVGDFVASIRPNVINLQDVAAILAVYTELTVPVTADTQKFDINYDQKIDLLDIAVVLSNYTALEVQGD